MCALMLIGSAILEDSAAEGNWPIVTSTVHNLTMPFGLPRVIQYSWKAPWRVRASRQLAARRFQILVLLPLSTLSHHFPALVQHLHCIPSQ